MKSVQIKTLSDTAEVSRTAALKFVALGNRAIKKNDRFNVVLAGGSTPRTLYQLLTTEEFCSQIDWAKVFFFFGDERDVSPNSTQSNFKMVNETLFKPLDISKKNIFRWQTEIINAVETAEQYEQRIRNVLDLKKNEFPRFDLVFLGMGDDGHTASLFPFTEALLETKKLAVANLVEKLDSYRLTLTFPAINQASNVIFLVCGENKATTLKKVLEGNFQPDKFPSQMVKPTDGKLFWLIDEEAAQLLKK